MSSSLDDLLCFVHAMPDFLILQNVQGDWVAANETALRFLRLDGVEYQGKRTAELLHAAGLSGTVSEVLEQSVKSVWESRCWKELEIPFSFQDGRTRLFSMKLVPMFDSAGRPKWLMIHGRDRTVRSLMEEEIALASKVFESVSDGIFVTDVDGTILFVNPAFTTVTGYSAEEVIGKNPRLLKSGRQGPKFYEQMWSELLEKGFYQGEIYNRKKSGQIYPESLTINAIKDRTGKTTNYVATFRDISEREQVRKDVMLTGKIQRKFLPPDYRDEQIVIKTFFKPSQYVSGDLYDYRWRKPGEVLFGYLIDVMGHGLATALQASVLRVLFLQAAYMDLPLAEKMAWINRESIRYFTEDTFAAAICYEFDFKAGTITYVSCGINYFIASTKEARGVIKVPGTFLALNETTEYEQHVMPIEQGDSFYFVTDGVYDKLPVPFKTDIPCFDEMIKVLKNTIFMQRNKDDATAISFHITTDRYKDTREG